MHITTVSIVRFYTGTAYIVEQKSIGDSAQKLERVAARRWGTSISNIYVIFLY